MVYIQYQVQLHVLLSLSPQPQGLYILEALAASGLRSIRYALEIPAIDSIVANDFSNQAYESICRNIRENGVDHLISPSCREARFACVFTIFCVCPLFVYLNCFPVLLLLYKCSFFCCVGLFAGYSYIHLISFVILLLNIYIVKSFPSLGPAKFN